MKVLDLRCDNGHGFEGWFGSEDDYLDQNGRGLIECPFCASSQVSRMPSAPRLNLSGPRQETPPSPDSGQGSSAPDDAQAMQAQWLQTVRRVLKNTEDVGERFTEEARRIHYGEVPHRGIRGQATTEQRQALQEEGIEVMPLPLPAALKGPVQ